jgi:hypothetical protein
MFSDNIILVLSCFSIVLGCCIGCCVKGHKPCDFFREIVLSFEEMRFRPVEYPLAYEYQSIP